MKDKELNKAVAETVPEALPQPQPQGPRVAGYVTLGAGILLMMVAFLGSTWHKPVLPLNETTSVPQAANPTPTEPLLPTRTPPADGTAQSSVPQRDTVLVPAAGTVTTTASPASQPPTTLRSSATPQPGATEAAAPASTTAPPAASEPDRFVVPVEERFRLGVSLPVSELSAPVLGALQVGWVMNWRVAASPAAPAGVMYAQTVRMKWGVLTPPAETLRDVAAAQPGSLWLISNEPDVRWQDSVTAEQYATLYHEAYHAIKGVDPAAVVAAGGIAQPTPLRLRYLDEVLSVYQSRYGEPLPAQAWQIHNYMLREERDSWGVDIPPGMPDANGELYSVADSGNLELFKTQIYAFRRWMAERGYRGLPLVITEYGNPMPADYGFPPEQQQDFLQEVWRFLLTARDDALGDPDDGGRLVQRWCWFSMYDDMYPSGNLVETEDMQTWTPLGEVWLRFVGTHP